MKHRWQRKKEWTSHADDWLMTYADMITLLLCFFAIFLSVSIPKKDIPKKAETPPVEQPVKEPDIMRGNMPFHALSDADMPVEEDDFSSPPAMPVAAPSTPPQAPPIVEPLETKAVVAAENNPPVEALPPAIVPPPDSSQISLPVKESADPSPAKSVDSSPSLPEIVNHLKSQGTANIEQKGDRITTLQISSAAFFSVGSATVSGSGKSILQEVAATLKSDQFRDYRITVEGHTDDTPINTAPFPSNWELSTARASAVVHFFLDQGIPARKLRAAGYADTFPLVPNRDASGNAIPENQAQNRRVIIKLEKIDKTE